MNSEVYLGQTHLCKRGPLSADPIVTYPTPLPITTLPFCWMVCIWYIYNIYDKETTVSNLKAFCWLFTTWKFREKCQSTCCCWGASDLKTPSRATRLKPQHPPPSSIRRRMETTCRASWFARWNANKLGGGLPTFVLAREKPFAEGHTVTKTHLQRGYDEIRRNITGGAVKNSGFQRFMFNSIEEFLIRKYSCERAKKQPNT